MKILKAVSNWELLALSGIGHYFYKKNIYES
jgi:hypothetical protein